MDIVRPTVSQELATEMRQAVDDVKTTLQSLGDIRMLQVEDDGVTLYDLSQQRFRTTTHVTPNGYVLQVLEIGDPQ